MSPRQPAPKAQLEQSLERFPAAVVAIARSCLPRLRRAFPGAAELVYDYTSSLVVALSPTGRGYEAPVAMQVAADGVRLYFDRSLPDPEGLLEGKGSKVRSVAVAAANALDRGALHDLLAAAVARAAANAPRAKAAKPTRAPTAKRRPVAKRAPAPKPRPAAKRARAPRATTRRTRRG